MTSGRHGRTPGPVRNHVGPVGGTTQRQRGGGSFTDRVMARVAVEPTPAPSRVFVRSLRRLAIRDALAALVAAWRLAFEPASPVTTSARASAAALFLSVIIVVGVGGAFVAGGALSLLGPDGAAPQELAPAAAPVESPAATIGPTPSPSPTPIVTRSATERVRTESEDRAQRETPKPQERKQEKREKRETPEPKERKKVERDERDEKDERDEQDERDEKDEKDERDEDD